MYQAGKKMRKPQKQKEMYSFLEDTLSLSRKGFTTKSSEHAAQPHPRGLWRRPTAFRGLPLCGPQAHLLL